MSTLNKEDLAIDRKELRARISEVQELCYGGSPEFNAMHEGAKRRLLRQCHIMWELYEVLSTRLEEDV